MSIVQSSPPVNMTTVRVDFRENDFDQFIWEHGYNLLIEKSVTCPCAGAGSHTALSDCQNCRGSGFVFINPLQTKGLVTGIREALQLKEWSLEYSGDVSITLRDVDRGAWMDRVTLVDDVSIFSEICSLRVSESSQFIFTSYEVRDIEDVFVFTGSENKLVRISPDDYSINPLNPYNIIFNYDFDNLESFNGTVSLRYKHNIQYHIYSTPHDIRSQWKKNRNGQMEKQKLPNQYLGRRAHEQLNLKNFDGTGLKDNSYR